MFSKRQLILLSCVSLACDMLFPAAALADVKAEGSEDAVAFFKHALGSPRDIEAFSASICTIRERLPAEFAKYMRENNMTNLTPRVQYFEGARAGSNFFLRSKGSREPTISGRQGSEAYNVMSNGVSFGFEGFDAKNPSSSDRISQASDSAFGLTCQFLNMGIGRVTPESIVWSGDDFVGYNELGRSIYGRLKLSNGLPWDVTLRWGKGGSPFKMIVYEYPEPLWSLGGFPKKATIWSLFDGALQPFLELAFSEVHLAQHRLADEFFDPARFVTANTLHTNIWTRDRVTSISPRGKHTATLAAVKQSLAEGRASSWQRRIIWVCIALVTLVPAIIFSAKKQNSKKQTVNE